MGQLWRAVLQLHHFRLPFAVNGDDEEIVKLLFINGGNNVTTEPFDHVRNPVAVADDERALAGSLQNFVDYFGGRLFRDESKISRVWFESQRGDAHAGFGC